MKILILFSIGLALLFSCKAKNKIIVKDFTIKIFSIQTSPSSEYPILKNYSTKDTSLVIGVKFNIDFISDGTKSFTPFIEHIPQGIDGPIQKIESFRIYHKSIVSSQKEITSYFYNDSTFFIHSQSDEDFKNSSNAAEIECAPESNKKKCFCESTPIYFNVDKFIYTFNNIDNSVNGENLKTPKYWKFSPKNGTYLNSNDSIIVEIQFNDGLSLKHSVVIP